jgi:hypothetical protein
MLRGFQVATLIGLEPTTSCVTDISTRYARSCAHVRQGAQTVHSLGLPGSSCGSHVRQRAPSGQSFGVKFGVKKTGGNGHSSLTTCLMPQFEQVSEAGG